MGEKTKIWYLEKFNLLASLSPAEMAEMEKATSMRSCHKNQVIFFENDPSDRIYFLKEGEIKLTRYDEGRELIIAILGPGEVFGELAISGQDKRDETAEATRESVICMISTGELEMMMNKNPRFNLGITKLMGLRLLRVKNSLASLVFKSSEQRVISFIRESASAHGRITPEGVEVALRLTHDNIAKLTATSRPLVTSVFSELEKKGVITYTRKKILVRQPQKLV